MKSIDLTTTLPENCDAAVYFMEDEGNYVFVYKNGSEILTKNVLGEDLRAAFSDQESLTQWVPHSVVAYGYSTKGKWFIAYHDQMKINMSVKDKDPLSYLLPPTILFSIGGKHYLYAVKTDEISKSTNVFAAPFMNCDSEGSICWGTNGYIESTPENAEKIWHTLLESVATHTNNDRVSKEHKNLYDLVKALKGKRKYPLDDLIPAGTVSQVLEKYT